MIHRVEMEWAGRILSLESGRVARQADGAVLVRYADTVVLATVVQSKEPREDVDFLPLTVEFRERMYAAGKIPGGFFKREGRPSEMEVLASRMIDRPIRPLFPEGYHHEVQIMVTVLSSDQENDADLLGLIGASTALALSPIPFPEAIGAARIGFVDGQFMVNPTFSELEESALDLVVAGLPDGRVIMLEAGAREVPEEQVVEAVRLAQDEVRKVCALQEELIRACGKEKEPVPEVSIDWKLWEVVDGLAREEIRKANFIAGKQERQDVLDDLACKVWEELADRFPDGEREVSRVISEIEREEVRRMILEEGRRVDGRRMDELRPITCEVGLLPRTHGSALFTRGETQALAVATLGTKMDEQKIEALEGESWKSYMLHYNFPPFCVGEARPLRGPSRREIGHGALAERAIQPVIPSEEVFPYTIRIVSDILESNGSSSMATVCAGSLSLMDAGVPIKTAVAGVSIGLVKEGEREVLLTDIAGAEDHCGDMDFKVAGTRDGVTAIQMDLKIPGISPDLVARALEQAKAARMEILDAMARTLARPREELSIYAPRILTLHIKPSKIGEVIGPGGRVIREITEKTGATIDIEDDGTVFIAASDPSSGEAAKEWIERIVAEPEIGKVYEGTVTKVVPFGAFVEFMPGKEGLIHISELDIGRVRQVTDVVEEGDKVSVKVTGMDEQGKVRLSRKAVLEEQLQNVPPVQERVKKFFREDKRRH